MKKYRKILICIIAVFALSGCDNQILDSNDFNLNQEIDLIRDQFFLPIYERLSTEDLKEFNKYQHINNPTEADIENFTKIINKIITVEEFTLLNKSVKRILDANPELAGKSKSEIQENLLIKLQIPYQKSCNATAINAVASIAAIEATWIGAMLTCVAATFGYGLCAGLATFVKYAAFAAVMANVAACEQ